MSTSAINSAVSGLQSAGKQLEKSARAIAAPQTQKSNTDVAENLVKENVASYDYQANLKTIQVADQMQKALLDIKT